MENMSLFESKIPEFTFCKKDSLALRTGTFGFQPKFFTKDNKYFVKTQAVISGVLMNDWLVEVIASDFCKQLGIPCVEQKECVIHYTSMTYKGVYSDNFELKGFTFMSFESLMNRIGFSTSDDSYVKLSTVEKIKWSAEKIALIGQLPISICQDYLIDLIVIDCLVGNVDRHTRNFGLFYNKDSGFSIPLIFDNGMGLFEHDYYRDNYKTYAEAMGNVYVAPYGEDPFDMMDILKNHFDLSRYKFDNLKMPNQLPNQFSEEYLLEMLKKVKG